TTRMPSSAPCMSLHPLKYGREHSKPIAYFGAEGNPYTHSWAVREAVSLGKETTRVWLPEPTWSEARQRAGGTQRCPRHKQPTGKAAAEIFHDGFVILRASSF